MASLSKSPVKVNRNLKSPTKVEQVIEALQAHARRCPDRPMSPAELVRVAWGPNYLQSDYRSTLWAHISMARAALGDDPTQPRYIQTERGAGYWWIGPLGEERAA